MAIGSGVTCPFAHKRLGLGAVVGAEMVHHSFKPLPKTCKSPTPLSPAEQDALVTEFMCSDSDSDSDSESDDDTAEVATCLFGTCDVACKLASRGHIWFRDAATDADRKGLYIHDGGQTSMPGLLADRVPATYVASLIGRNVRLQQAVYKKKVLFKVTDPIFMVQLTPANLISVAFIARTTNAVFLVIDLLFETPTSSGKTSERIVLTNVYRSLQRMGSGGNACAATGWHTCPHPEALHHEARRANDKVPGTARVRFVGFAATQEAALAFAPLATPPIGAFAMVPPVAV